MPGDELSPIWLFVQLPVSSHDLKYNLSHCAYASSAVSSYLKNGLDIDVCRLDPTIEALGSDSCILEYILEASPSCVCFSVYLWNVERSLYIANKVKQYSPHTLVIFGGPEVTLDNDFLIQRPGFDLGVIGEGENAILYIATIARDRKEPKEILRILKKDKGIFLNKKVFIKGSEVCLDNVPSSYIKGNGSLSLDGSMLIESMRGCVHSCKYCYYHKNFNSIRYFPYSRVLDEITWGKDRGAGEISFLDPSFLRRRRPKEFLNRLMNITGEMDISIFCELNAEDVTYDLAQLMAEANIKSTEVGLQTINEKTLCLINRKFNRKKFVNGIFHLKNAGIDVVLDLIVGLPGDRVEDICKGVDFILNEILLDDMGMYPLYLLPGTQLKEQANYFGIKYSSKPPYLVKATPLMSQEDIRESFLYAEQISGIDLFPREFPLPSIDEKIEGVKLIYMIELDSSGRCYREFLLNDITRLTSTIVLKICDSIWINDISKLKELYSSILEKNPYELIDIIFDEDILKDVSLDFIMYAIKDILSMREYYLDRIYCDTIDIIRSTQIFILFKSPFNNLCLVSIPSSWFTRRDNESIFWFMLYGMEDINIEEYFLDNFKQYIGLDSFYYRISYNHILQEKENVNKLPIGKIKLGI